MTDSRPCPRRAMVNSSANKTCQVSPTKTRFFSLVFILILTVGTSFSSKHYLLSIPCLSLFIKKYERAPITGNNKIIKTHTAFVVSSILRLRRFKRGIKAGKTHKIIKTTLGSSPDNNSPKDVGITNSTSRYY